MDKIEELLTRGVANIIPSKEELEKKLRSGKKLNVYLGIDPTATKIHLGNAVPLRKLQKFSELGHNVTFLIGDFTALIGDTSDKDSERPVLTKEQIEENFKTYKKQAEKILDFSKIKVRYNSEWLGKLTFRDVVNLAQQFSFGDFGSRELIKKRLLSGKHVGLHEGLYPAMQGYDSYYLDTDIQIGGTDQTFNMQAGRILQKNWRKKESFILANEFLAGTDGRKMSKTWNNAIWLEDKPSDMYAKILAINDDLIIQYFTLATNILLSEISEIEKKLKSSKNPIETKKKLAFEIVKELHSENDAKKAQEHFERVVQQRELIPVFEMQNIPTWQRPRTLISGPTIVEPLIETNTVQSKSEVKRLVEQGGTAIITKDGEERQITDIDTPLPNEEVVIRVGKRKFVRIKSKSENQ